MKKILKPLAVALCAVLPSATIAATTTDPIIITATRTARTVDETMAPVTVIDQADIERQNVRSVSDLLRATPGISLSNNGGRGKSSSVFLRGTESDHVLVLIDGIKVGSATLGTTPFQDLPVEQIDRIEVVRGPRSHLYGSEAIGGVIQIFTKKGGGETTPSFSIGAGSLGTTNATAGISGGGDNGWFNISASTEDTDGFNACNGELLVGGCFTHEPDDDGYENTSANIRGGFRFSETGEIDLHWLNSNNEAQFDGDFQNRSETKQEIVGAKLRTMVGANTEFSLNLGRSKDLSDNFKDAAFTSRFDTERDSASVQADFFSGDAHIITAGFDYLDDTVSGDTAYAVDSRDNTGLLLQYQGTFDRIDVQFGARNDDNEQFGSNTTGGLTVGHRLAGGQRLTFAWGTAFKAPTFNELYFPGFGNPHLDPEESESFELGIDSGDGKWSINIFNTDIDQLIGFDPFTFAPVNINSARIRGLEAVVSAQLAGWNTSASLTLLDPENRGAGFEGNDLPRRAQESLRVDIDRDFGRFAAGASLIAEGSKYDDLANQRNIDSYQTVDLRAALPLGDSWKLQFRVENLFDEVYETASYYNQAERGYYVTLRYVPRR